MPAVVFDSTASVNAVAGELKPVPVTLDLQFEIQGGINQWLFEKYRAHKRYRNLFETWFNCAFNAATTGHKQFQCEMVEPPANWPIIFYPANCNDLIVIIWLRPANENHRGGKKAHSSTTFLVLC